MIANNALEAFNLAEKYQLTRDEVDGYALRSQQAAKAAWDAGVFEDEVGIVITVEIPRRHDLPSDRIMFPVSIDQRSLNIGLTSMRYRKCEATAPALLILLR